MKRREFLAKTGVAASTVYSIMPSKVLGANDRIRVAVMGCGRIAQRNVPGFQKIKEVEIVGLTEVYDSNLKKLQQRTGLTNVPTFTDYRKMLELPDVDVLLNCTPDHWHALPTIDACNMGMDVYVEKPIGQSVVEGRAMVDAARKNNAIVQAGTQQRSGAHFQRAIEIVRSGILGTVSMVRCWNAQYQWPVGIGNPPDGDPPAGLDWDMWLGPAPMRPHNRNYWDNEGDWGRFRWFFDYAGGMMTDWFTHLIDIVHPAMNVTAPKAVTTIGDKYHMLDNRDTPDTVEAVLEYDDFICTYNNTTMNNRGLEGHGYGILFYGTEATMFLDRSGYEVMPRTVKQGSEMVPSIAPIKSDTSEQFQNHVQNFINCLHSRELPVSDILECHYSTTASHLCNVAMRSKERIEWDAKAERITNHDAPNKYLFREYRAPWKLPV